MVAGIPTITTMATITCLIFVVFRGLLTPTRSKATGGKTKRTLALCSGLLTNPLSKTSNVYSTSPSAT